MVQITTTWDWDEKAGRANETCMASIGYGTWYVLVFP